MLQLDPRARPTIEEVLSDPFFSRDLQITEEDKLLRSICDDLIRRCGVFKLEGEVKTLETLEDTL